MIKKLLITALMATLVLSSCSNKTNFNVAAGSFNRMPEYTKLDKINKKFISKVGKKFKVNLKTRRDFLFTTNYKLLLDGAFDMAILANTNPNSKDSTLKENSVIKAVLPINSRILYIAYNKEKIHPTTIEDLFEGRNVAILSNETAFIKSILSDFGVNIANVNFLLNRMNIGDEDSNKFSQAVRDSIQKIDYFNAYKQDKPIQYDVEIGFSPQNFDSKSRLYKLLDNRREFALYSLDDYRLFRNGSKAEGFCLRNKYFTPFLLPKGAFGEFPETPVITIREDFILAARDEVDDEFIYDFVKTAIEETDLIDMATYGQNFENISFAFPIHEGTKRYLDKNAPKFYEKYGELLGKIGAGIGGIYTALMGFLLWRKRRKRRTIVNDFEKVLNIQAKLNEPYSSEDLNQLYMNLQEIQKSYHLRMIEHKILVDETLQIFFDMIDKTERYILEALKLKKEENK